MKFSISFLVAILTATQCLAQSFSSLAIYVFEDETGGSVTGASVIIKEAGWATKSTGSDGKVFFDKSMPIGEIHYIISKEGYQGLEGTFNITTEEKSNSLKIKLSKFRDDRLLITGEVIDDNDKEIEGAIIEVKVADIIKTTKTDISGNYKIELTFNRTQYDVNTLKLEAKCNDGRGKNTETIELTRRNVIYKDIRLACNQEPNEGADIYSMIDLFKKFRTTDNFEDIAAILDINAIFFMDALSVQLKGASTIKSHFDKKSQNHKIGYFNSNNVNVSQFGKVCAVSYEYDYEDDFGDDYTYTHSGKEILIFENQKGAWKLIWASIDNGGYRSHKK
jgi:hypothetical protein